MLSALGGDNLGSGGAVGLSWSLSAFDAGVVGSGGSVGLSCSLPCSLRNLTWCFMIGMSFSTILSVSPRSISPSSSLPISLVYFQFWILKLKLCST